MESIRKFHNSVKRNLIQSVTFKGQYVLDVGCGCGGDIQKWNKCGAILFACDPSNESLKEASSRANTMKIPVQFYEGDILSSPDRVFDIICYNFSLHYIFNSRDLFFKSINAIRRRLRPGCKLIGVIPDSQSILMSTPFNDDFGNVFVRSAATGNGAFGEKVFVNLADTPYYKGEARPEPIAYKDLLITHLEELGIYLESWKPIVGEYEISGLYSSFIFVCK